MRPRGTAKAGEAQPTRLRALVVDDEVPLVRVITGYLEREGFDVVTAGDGERAVELARTEAPDVIILDLMLPGIDGIEACRRIRGFSDAYVVMLTARAEELDKVIGLSTGADDYMTKPFSPRELVARVRSMLRRPRTERPSHPRGVRRVGDLVIDPETREVLRDERPVALTRTEFDLLCALAERPRVVLSREQLLERVWGGEWFGDEHVVDVHVANLRHKLGDTGAEGRYIQTVRGVGYRSGPAA